MPAGDFPIVRIFEWDTTEVASPVGDRTTPGGTFAFKQMVSLGCASADPLDPATSGTLVFPGTQFDHTSSPYASELASTPVAITFNIAVSGTAISDIKLYLIDDSAFQASVDEGLDRAFMQYAPSGSIWKSNFTLPSGSIERIPTTVPSVQNIRRQDGSNALVGTDDTNSSEFVYLNIVVPLGAPLGTFGVCGSGLLRLGLVFNFWNNDFILEFGDVG
jgi:hypothetical protein